MLGRASHGDSWSGDLTVPVLGGGVQARGSWDVSSGARCHEGSGAWSQLVPERGVQTPPPVPIPLSSGFIPPNEPLMMVNDVNYCPLPLRTCSRGANCHTGLKNSLDSGSTPERARLPFLVPLPPLSPPTPRQRLSALLSH